MGGLSLERLASSTRTPVALLEVLLREEERRGHAVRVGGRWEATPRLVREFGAAFGEMGAGLDSERRRRR
jgi:hypothetical protein